MSVIENCDFMSKDSRGSIVLKRSVDVQCWHVQGDVGFPKKREELMAVLLRVQENPLTDAGDIAEHLLFERLAREQVAMRLLAIAEDYGLLERSRSGLQLTSAGMEAIECEEVFVPQRGNWELWVSDDPMMESAILHIAPFSEPSAYDEVRGRDKDKAGKRDFADIPGFVLDAVKQSVRPLVGKSRIRLESLEGKGESVAYMNSPDQKGWWAEGGLGLEWAVNDGGLRVRGSLGGNKVDAEMSVPEVSYDDVWQELLGQVGLLAQWDISANALRVDFSETTEDERESCLRALSIRRPFLEGLGEFEDVLVRDVALRASSSDEAAIWADHRLKSRIRDYATEKRFSAWTEEAINPFREFEGMRLLAARDDMADQAWREVRSSDGRRPSPFTWHLVAAEDWGL